MTGLNELTLRQTRGVLSGTVLLAVGVAAAQVQPPAFFRKDIPVSGSFLESAAFTVGDFNRDGKPDMAIASQTGIAVLLNAGISANGGTVQFAREMVTEVSQPGPILSADFNGDGVLDLVGIGWGEAPGPGLPPRPVARLLAGRGDGTFSMPREIGPAIFAATGDFNGDGMPDLVLSNPDTSLLTILIGSGGGSFRVSQEIERQGLQPVVADFDHDGKADIAVAFFPNTIAIFPGRGDGTFRAPLLTSADGIDALLVADFNRDGVPDLATRFGILLGNGDGSFRSPISYPPVTSGAIPAGHFPCTAADFNGDGKIDLAMCASSVNPAMNEVWVLLGDGSGTMSSAVTQTVGWQPSLGAIGDFDGDGKPELAVLNCQSRTVSVLFNRIGQEDAPLTRAVSAASGSAVVAPGSLATLFIPTGATVTEQASPPWPTRLGGISLSVGSGSAAALAQLLYVSPTQINFQVPNLAPGAETRLSIQRAKDETTAAGSMEIQEVAPGLFMADQPNLTPVFTVPASGSSLISFYGTGFRNAMASNVKCTIAGFPAAVQYAGPQATPGVDQIDIRMPDEVLFRIEDESIAYAEVVLSIDGIQANAAVLVFRYR